MDNTTLQIFYRIARGLSQVWDQEKQGDAPDFRKFSVEQISMQGATSISYRLKFATEKGPSRSFFVKQYAAAAATIQRQLNTEFHTATQLSAELGDHTALSVDPPLLMLPEDRILVTAYVVGDNLSPYFFKSLRWPLPTKRTAVELNQIVSKIAEGLADLQNVSIDAAYPVVKNNNPLEIFTAIKTEMKKFIAVYAEQGDYRNLVEETVRQIEKCLGDYLSDNPKLCFQHNDYILQNFIIDADGELHLFDFANSTIGIPYFDMAHLINSLEDLTYLKTVSKKLVNQLKLTFLASFVNSKSFQPRLLSAVRAYIQIYSGTILLCRTKTARKGLLRNIVMTAPEQRFEDKLSSLLAEIS